MRDQRPPRLVLAGLVLASLAGCSLSAEATKPATPTAGSSSRPVVATAAPSSPPAASSPIPDGLAKAWLLVGHPGERDLRLVLSTTGEVEDLAIPDGAPAPRWQRVVSARIDGAATLIRDDVVQPGFGGPELRIDGHWTLPTIGLDPIHAGRSLDGSTVALVAGPYDPSAARSRFAILDHFLMNEV